MSTQTADRVLVAHQPAYLPWPGYFAKLLGVDRLVVLDHVQFCERGWQHRNRVLGHAGGYQLLTVPVRRRFGQPISEVRIDPVQPWAHRHWRTLTQVYGHAPGWRFLGEELGMIYTQLWERLVDLDLAITRLMLDRLGLRVRLACSSNLGVTGRKTGMLVDLCEALGVRVLRVGAGGSLGYLDRSVLAQAGIEVEVVRFTYLPYQQGRRRREFVSGLSALDVLAHLGPQAAARVLADGARIECHAPDLLPQR